MTGDSSLVTLSLLCLPVGIYLWARILRVVDAHNRLPALIQALFTLCLVLSLILLVPRHYEPWVLAGLLAIPVLYITAWCGVRWFFIGIHQYPYPRRAPLPVAHDHEIEPDADEITTEEIELDQLQPTNSLQDAPSDQR